MKRLIFFLPLLLISIVAKSQIYNCPKGHTMLNGKKGHDLFYKGCLRYSATNNVSGISYISYNQSDKKSVRIWSYKNVLYISSDTSGLQYMIAIYNTIGELKQQKLITINGIYKDYSLSPDFYIVEVIHEKERFINKIIIE